MCNDEYGKSVATCEFRDGVLHGEATCSDKKGSYEHGSCIDGEDILGELLTLFEQ